MRLVNNDLERDLSILSGRTLLRQLNMDRVQSNYWQHRWAADHGDDCIEAWLRSYLDWLGDDEAYTFDADEQ